MNEKKPRPSRTGAAVASDETMTLFLARTIGLKLRCDHRTVLREWRSPNSVRGLLGEVLRLEFRSLRKRPVQ
jgi:hypothetical protein